MLKVAGSSVETVIGGWSMVIKWLFAHEVTSGPVSWHLANSPPLSSLPNPISSLCSLSGVRRPRNEHLLRSNLAELSN